MAFVNPSQHSPDKANHSWLGVTFEGEIITAHCTCIYSRVSNRMD